MTFNPDIQENDLLHRQPALLEQLLCDHTTGSNIRWCTHDYELLGAGYGYRDEISPSLITGERGDIIKPRVLKSKEQQTGRVRGMAEVFTPMWVVKIMVDNVEVDIDTRCLELTCGEAPFLVSRYDATTGAPVAVADRVGILDRKMRLVNGKQLGDEEWLAQVRMAFQSTYGYEWQGDSLLLARENLLYTFVDYYEARYGKEPDIELMQKFAEIISWNLWQMDGLTYRTPQEKKEQPQLQGSLFDEVVVEAPSPLCVITDWQKGEKRNVIEIKNRNIMKFDVIIGNPPFDEEVEGNERKKPIYNYFMDEAFKIGELVELITPARFLFNAGQTPKAWNNKILSDEGFKVLHYESQSSTVFSNVDIKGGVAITYHSAHMKYGAIGNYIPFEELCRIKEKVVSYEESRPLNNNRSIKFLSDITVGAVPYRFTNILKEDHPELINDGKIASSFDLRSNVIDNLYDILFFANKPDEVYEYVKILGLLDTKRTYLWIRRDYISVPSNFEHYKVFLPESNGAGAFEALSSPIVVEPKIGHTQTFISMGKFDNRQSAENLLCYLKTKFCRALLGTLKTTQHNSKATWANVPLQDFTSNSDIDWSKSIEEIDEQLFDKYGLDDKEREFIRTKVKEMK